MTLWDIVKSNYAYFLVFLLPFVFFLMQKPSICDEYGHWLLLPKIFCHTNELVTAAVTSGVGYTPLWTLQAAFFELITPGNFSESVIAVIKMGVFVSFLFFLKETLNLKTSLFLVFSLLTFLITLKFNRHLLIEFPLYILSTSMIFLIYALEKNMEEKDGKNLLFLLLVGALSIYMVKKSMLAIFPSVLWYLWVKNYKKELVSFVLVFCFFAISWKLKNYDKSELLVPGQTINSFLSADAFIVYAKFVGKIQENFAYFLVFGASLYFIFRESRKLFTFYAIFFLVFFTALLVSYLFSFHRNEAVIVASFIRYMTSVFYPAYTLALYILVSKIFENMEARGIRVGHKSALIGCALLSLTIGGGYVYQGYKGSSRDYVGHLISKIHVSHRPKNTNVLILGPDLGPSEYGRFHYHLYPLVQKLDLRSLDQLPYHDLDKFLSMYNLIVVRESNVQLDNFLTTHWGVDSISPGPFYLYKMKGKVELHKI